MTKNGTKKTLYIAIAILLFGVFDCINMYKIPSVLDTVCTTLNTDATTASWLMSVYSMTAFILAIPAGMLSKKFGYTKILFIGIVASVVGSAIGILSINICNIELMMCGRSLEGVCYIFSSICIPVIIQRLVNNKYLGTIMGIWAIRVPLACFIGQSFTPVIAGWAGVNYSWLIFCIMVIVSSAILLVVLKGINNIEISEDSKVTFALIKNQRRTIFNFAMFLVSFFIIALIQTAVMNYMPIILKKNFDMSSSLAGFLTSLPMIVSIFSSLLFGFICDKSKTYKYVYIIGCLLIGPGAYLMFNCYGAGFVVGQVLLGIGLGAPAVSANAVFEILRPELHSTGIGFGMATFCLGQVLGTNIAQSILGSEFLYFELCSIFLLFAGILGSAIACLSKTIKNTK